MSSSPDEPTAEELLNLAANFAMGVLGPTEARTVEALAAADPHFAGMVRSWQQRLERYAERNRQDDEAEPDGPGGGDGAEDDLRIGAGPSDEKLPPRPEPLHGELADAARVLNRWRMIALGTSVMTIISSVAAILLLLAPEPRLPQPLPNRTAAVLTAPGVSTVGWLVTIDMDRNEYGVTPIGDALGPVDRSLQLWFQPPGDGAPRSLGLLLRPDRFRVPPEVVRSGGRLFITSEPSGGSKGGPTGEILFEGPIRLTEVG